MIGYKASKMFEKLSKKFRTRIGGYTIRKTVRSQDRLAEAITEDVVKILDVAKKDVVIIFQASHGNWYASGVRL
jgi:hypothetical protein